MAKETIKDLKKLNESQTVMISGLMKEVGDLRGMVSKHKEFLKQEFHRIMGKYSNVGFLVTDPGQPMRMAPIPTAAETAARIAKHLGGDL